MPRSLAPRLFAAAALVLPVILCWAVPSGSAKDLEWQLPSARKRIPFEKEVPLVFVPPRSADWAKLSTYWNPSVESAAHPVTGLKTERTIIKLKLPQGLTIPPTAPLENPMTLQRWELGRKLYFDPILSSDGAVSCATCHDPRRGFTDQSAFSTGIGGLRGGMNAPTVMNSAYNPLQFWDGRALSLEHQAQGPVQNPLEMCVDEKSAWPDAVRRLRKNSIYVRLFQEAFGTEPTRDAAAMAIATYERTVLNGNSIHDRAEAAMRQRVADEEGTDFTLKPQDYAKTLKEAVSKKDRTALAALKIDPVKDAGNLEKVAAQINQGRALFFGKARCSLCHVGENFSDGQFHNLGIGLKDGKVTEDTLGRYAQLPLGHKNPEMVGAFKTPMLRGLSSTAPYMHDGSEKTLEEVIELYDRGGNVNEYLSPKMRDLAAEQLYAQSRLTGTEYKGPKVHLFGDEKKPIVPFELRLTKDEKAALATFLRALEGEVDSVVMDADRKAPLALER